MAQSEIRSDQDAMSAEDLVLLDRYWRAANYLSVGQIYLLANPLLREPLRPEHVKPRLLGHWGTTPGLNFIYAHLNRIIRARDLDVIYICGPGHGEPDVVMACAGDVPTLETLAAVDLLREALPDLKIRVVNVVDLMTLQPKDEHPHGLTDRDIDTLFTPDKPVIFAYHGYPHLIHRLTYSRANHANMHVRGFIEEGTTTTPFDMVVLNELDRFHLAIEAIERVPGLSATAAHTKQRFRDKLIEHKLYIREHGEDMPEILGWTWPYQSDAEAGD